jgi:hypothetical protein
MNRIEVNLDVAQVAPVLDSIKPVLAALESETAFAPEMAEADRELEGVWRAGLIHTQVEDCRKLMGLFGAEFFNSGRIELTEENADPVLRATSAIRLKLRATVLKKLGDEALQNEAFEEAALTDREKIGCCAYLFLERLQEVVVKHLGI